MAIVNVKADRKLDQTAKNHCNAMVGKRLHNCNLLSEHGNIVKVL